MVTLSFLLFIACSFNSTEYLVRTQLLHLMIWWSNSPKSLEHQVEEHRTMTLWEQAVKMVFCRFRLRILIGSTDAFTVSDVSLPTVLFFPSRCTCTVWQGIRGALGSRQRYGDQARCRRARIYFPPKDPITLRGLTGVI